MSQADHAQSIEFLEEISRGECQLPESVDAASFAVALLPNLHSTDLVLRDKLSYIILIQLLDKGLLDSETVAEILRLIVSDDYLLHDVGEVESDSVFGRSFSALIVAAVLIVDARDPQVPTKDIHLAIEKTISYAYAESDYRGYVDGKGWAHAVAHTADALGACAQHPAVTADERSKILDAIGHLATVDYLLYNREDDRLAYPVSKIILHDTVGGIDWQAWIQNFDKSLSLASGSRLRLDNAVHFLKSLYFMVLLEHPSWPWLEMILDTIKRLHVADDAE